MDVDFFTVEKNGLIFGGDKQGLFFDFFSIFAKKKVALKKWTWGRQTRAIFFFFTFLQKKNQKKSKKSKKNQKKQKKNKKKKTKNRKKWLFRRGFIDQRVKELQGFFRREKELEQERRRKKKKKKRKKKEKKKKRKKEKKKKKK